jgi:hypothetical protein
MFDYNPINEESNTLTVKPFGDQVLKLRKVINSARAEYSGATIDLVCHSQGCVVAALLKPRDIRKIIMLTPPVDVSETRLLQQLGTRNGIEIDVNARTRLQRSDGSTTVIHPDYWQSLSRINPMKLYERLERFTQLRIISARQDEVLGDVSFDALKPAISCVVLDGNHNFSEEESRKRVVYIVKKELVVN